jgi:hypothetical protein
VWAVWKEGTYGHGLPFKKLSRSRPIDQWIPCLTGDVVPFRERILSPLETRQLAQQNSDWLRKGITEITRQAEWTNNPVFVEKKDGRTRVCIDCRPANLVTQDYDWPLPRLQDLRRLLKGNKWFARIDLRDAFFRVAIPGEWRHLTAFRDQGQTYQFRKMPFGLKTAPSTFQRLMDNTLNKLRHICWWYIDDVLLFADEKAKLRQAIKQVEKALTEARHVINYDS